MPTETVHPGPAAARPANYLNSPAGLRSWLTTVDHKRIGVMYLIAIMASLALGGLFAMLIRVELWTPTRTIMNDETYNRLFTLHGAVMVFLFIIPSIPAALGNFLLPILIGARDVAFPKLNLASFYIYVTGALFAVYSLVSGAVDTGWTF
jgi:cytochrome c oxidase subunit 1